VLWEADPDYSKGYIAMHRSMMKNCTRDFFLAENKSIQVGSAFPPLKYNQVNYKSI
jgi:hypothetical protein